MPKDAANTAPTVNVPAVLRATGSYADLLTDPEAGHVPEGRLEPHPGAKTRSTELSSVVSV